MTIKKVLVAAVLLGALVVASGCSQAATPSGGSATPAPAAADVELPTIQLVSPVEGDTVASGDLKVVVETTNLKYTMPSNTNVPGEGHVHFTLDDEPFQMSTTPDYTFKDVAPGEHRLVVEVVQNNTESFDPPIEQEITFTVE